MRDEKILNLALTIVSIIEVSRYLFYTTVWHSWLSDVNGRNVFFQMFI